MAAERPPPSELYFHVIIFFRRTCEVDPDVRWHRLHGSLCDEYDGQPRINKFLVTRRNRSVPPMAWRRLKTIQSRKLFSQPLVKIDSNAWENRDVQSECFKLRTFQASLTCVEISLSLTLLSSNIPCVFSNHSTRHYFRSYFVSVHRVKLCVCIHR